MPAPEKNRRLSFSFEMDRSTTPFKVPGLGMDRTLSPIVTQKFDKNKHFFQNIPARMPDVIKLTMTCVLRNGYKTINREAAQNEPPPQICFHSPWKNMRFYSPFLLEPGVYASHRQPNWFINSSSVCFLSKRVYSSADR